MANNTIDSTTPVYTLSTASDLSGIPVHSIRQYVDRGLIIPFRKESGRHLFSQVDILRLKYINKLLDEGGLNIAGIRALFALIPCWAVRSCSPDDRESCHAYSNDEFPCWDASEKGIACKNIDCRECDVYRIVENYPGVKSFLKTLI
ncbi:MAG TPA: MerR family transcriptional regulator [Bacteroidales bacterium]|nr:MerR family transcriptional regulator [Bacteroidales bacterium]